jgi:phage FluMu gp28-like protein
MFRESKYFLPYQIAWIRDTSSLKIMEKSRQIGITFADAYDSVRKVTATVPMHVWVCSKDEETAIHYLEICKEWATILQIAAEDLGERIINSEKDLKARVLRFASGKCIYALSSSVNAVASRSGHVKLDEFALHPNQRLLYRYAEPVTTWGGSLSIISTHRGSNTLFNEILRDINERANPMGWSHHRVDIHDAVRAGLVEKINNKAGTKYAREDFLARCRKRCIDQEQWLQEYCCVPCDDNIVFIDYEMLTACQSPHCLQPLSYLQNSTNPLYAGVDLGRKRDLTVIDVGEKIGDVMWDRLRIELLDKRFAEIKDALYPILQLPNLQRCCIDATGLGIQLAEETKDQFGWKIEPITFNASIKETMAFDLRRAFEDRALRIDADPLLHADLRGIKKQFTSAGNIRFVGDTDDSHCDRFWAKALRQHAARQRIGTPGIAVA